MFSVTNSTWTLLAIVPSSTVGVCEFLIMSVFYFIFACVRVRVYVQSNSTFYIGFPCLCVDIKLCSSDCFTVYV